MIPDVSVVVVVVLAVATLLVLLAIAAKPEVECRLRRWRLGGDLTEALTARIREHA